MPKIRRIVMLTAGLLGSAGALADDRAPASLERPRVYSYEVPVETHPYQDSYAPIDVLEFYDNSMLGRLKRVREVSFLTLAESGRSRIYVGVNRDGMVGLHFRIR